MVARSLIDPAEPPEAQIDRQARIIDALVRRADRRHELGDTAYAAFQSAIALQGQIWAKTRDLERATGELESLRFDRARTQKTLSDALSVMEGGFGLFQDGRLEVCNALFVTLLPDIADRIRPGLALDDYLAMVAGSAHVADDEVRARLGAGEAMAPVVVELSGDRWFQFGRQRTGEGALVALQTEITGIVRANRLERAALIDMQAHYLQSAFDTMTLGLGTFDRAGALMIHNDRFRDLLGLPASLVRTGTRFTEVLDHVRRARLFSETDLKVVDGWPRRLARSEGLRQRVRHRGGWVLDIHVHLLPDRGFLVDIADVTLEHRATQVLEEEVAARTRDLTAANRRLREGARRQSVVEDELRLAKEAAEAAVRSKTRFFAAASHDLLQPINAAKLLISTLGDRAAEGAAGPDLGGMIRRLEDSFASVETLLHALLDISRLESVDAALTPVDFCIGPLMEAVGEDQAPLAARKGVELRVVPSSAWVRSDQRYLLRSIQNLVVNAIQYTRTGRVLMGCRRRAGRVVLEVWDTGAGISKRDQARVFEEFQRGGGLASDSGMGLGLSIVERTCRHLGHDLGLRSKPGVGSVFSIGMAPGRPRFDLPARAASRAPEGDLDLLAMVIENDADVLFAMASKLESWGASVFCCASTDEALACAADAGTAPDVILADYQLDGDDTGPAAIRAVRRATDTEVPAILVTADRRPELTLEGGRHGFEVLPKPVDLVRLRRLLGQLRPGGAGATDESRR